MNDDTLLYRQVNPAWVQQGRVTSQAFKPTTKDAGRLSVYNGDMTTAEASWTHYTQVLTFESVGVMAVRLADCTALALPVVPDPEPFPEHCIIDFTACSKSQVEQHAKSLNVKAAARGWLYRNVG